MINLMAIKMSKTNPNIFCIPRVVSCKMSKKITNLLAEDTWRKS